MRAFLLALAFLVSLPSQADSLKIEARGKTLPLQVKIKNISPQAVSFRFIRIEALEAERWVTVRESIDCGCGKTCAPSGYVLSPWNITYLKWDGLTSTCERLPEDATFRVAIDNSCVVDRSELRTLGISTPVKGVPSVSTLGSTAPTPVPVPERSCDLQMDVQGSPAGTDVRRKITFRGTCQKLRLGEKDMTPTCMDGAVLTELEDNQYSLLFFTRDDRRVFGFYGATPENSKSLPRTYSVNRFSTAFGTFMSAQGSCALSGTALRTSTLTCYAKSIDGTAFETVFASDQRTWPETDDE